MPSPQMPHVEMNHHAAPIIRTTQDAINAATDYVHADDQEWLCILSLDERETVIGYGFWRGNICPFEVSVKDLLPEAFPWNPSRFILVRHHPHDGPVPLRDTLPWVEDFYACCAALQIPCNYVAMYADGTCFDLEAQARSLMQVVLPFLPLASLLAGLNFL